LGVILIETNSNFRDDKSILVSNSVTNADGFFISILSNCYLVSVLQCFVRNDKQQFVSNGECMRVLQILLLLTLV